MFTFEYTCLKCSKCKILVFEGWGKLLAIRIHNNYKMHPKLSISPSSGVCMACTDIHVCIATQYSHTLTTTMLCRSSKGLPPIKVAN